MAAKVGARARPKSPLGKGLIYLTNQRQALERFLEDGRLPIDNMVVEREMRPVALGRKNWLFAGNFEAAERLADGLTVIATARMHGVDAVAYLGWLLPQLGRREWSVEAPPGRTCSRRTSTRPSSRARPTLRVETSSIAPA